MAVRSGRRGCQWWCLRSDDDVASAQHLATSILRAASGVPPQNAGTPAGCLTTGPTGVFGDDLTGLITLMSGYSTEDDDADRAYWSDPAHGGAGHDQDDDADEERVTSSDAAVTPSGDLPA
jgi:hypothetical protein